MNADLALVLDFLGGNGEPRPLAVSPLQIALRGELLALDSLLGQSQLAFTPDEHFVQGGGVVQGGIVATMLDYALAFAALTRLPAESSLGTATLTTNFLRPAAPGRLLASGKVVRMGARLVFAEAQIGPQGGACVATASCVMAIVPTKR